MKRSRLLIGTGYGLALLLLVLPILEQTVALLPLQPGHIRWRLQAFGALSQALLLPLVGVVVAVGTAVLLGQRRVVRVLAALALTGALLLAAGAVVFVLDLVQYRQAVGRELRTYYEKAGVIYLGSYVLGVSLLLWVAAVAWRAAGRHGPRSVMLRHPARPRGS